MTARALEWERSCAVSGASCASVRPVDAADDAGDGEEGAEIEVPEAELDEADLPPLDTDDPEAPLHEGMDYRDLLDGGWLERGADSADLEEDGAAYIDVGLTIELNGPDTGDELAQVLDLDVGSLLTLLPGEAVLPGEAMLAREAVLPGETVLPGVLPGDAIESDMDASRDLGASFGLNALRDMLLPEGVPERGEHADEDVGDDERFPAFEDSLIVTRQRPAPEEGEGVGDDDVI